jgi:hypothetical protein
LGSGPPSWDLCDGDRHSGQHFLGLTALSRGAHTADSGRRALNWRSMTGAGVRDLPDLLQLCPCSCGMARRRPVRRGLGCRQRQEMPTATSAAAPRGLTGGCWPACSTRKARSTESGDARAYWCAVLPSEELWSKVLQDNETKAGQAVLSQERRYDCRRRLWSGMAATGSG